MQNRFSSRCCFAGDGTEKKRFTTQVTAIVLGRVVQKPAGADPGF